ncbi:MAG: hypothetical protein GEV28_08775 [Actinophytocola sp.]|uniref:hypothetical protein n=1 Tax=Actinophytocola sp. TaxID=1872138 RepID=UPI00132C9E67|nr:hypothetical protein [Actinophytocola sp.]MPZ80471.1 hypothetical protein [Actinophytocola sp.]
MDAPTPQEITDYWHEMVDKASRLKDEDNSFQVLPGDTNQVTLPHEAITVPIAVSTSWLPAIISGNPVALTKDADELRDVVAALTLNLDLMEETENQLVEWEGDAAVRFATYRGKVGTALSLYEAGAAELARCLEGYSAMLAAARADAYNVIDDAMAVLTQYGEENEITGIRRTLNIFDAVASAIDAGTKNPLMLVAALGKIVNEGVDWVFIGGGKLQELVDSCAAALEKIYQTLDQDAPKFVDAFTEIINNLAENVPPEVAAGVVRPGADFDPGEFAPDDCPEFDAIHASGSIDTSAITPPSEGETEGHD